MNICLSQSICAMSTHSLKHDWADDGRGYEGLARREIARFDLAPGLLDHLLLS
jgi:hypothetical protein